MTHSTYNTLVELLQDRAANSSNLPAYTFLLDGETETVSLSYQQLEYQAKTIAVHLQSLCQPGEPVLLLYPPGLDYIAAFFGCLYAGVIAVPAYPPRPDRSLPRLKSIIEDTNAEIALTTKETLSSLEQFFPQLSNVIPLKWLATDTLDQAIANQWHIPNINNKTLAFLQYTSGSTATPKGVIISHHNLLHNLAAIHRCFGHSQDSKGVIWLPPYHDMGLIGGILQPLYGDFPVVLMSPLMFVQNPLRWLQSISNYGGTTSGGPNFAYDLCVRKVKEQQLETLDLRSWNVAFNGAEPIAADVLEKFAKTFAICGFRQEAFYPCYGMAEATLIISGVEKIAPPTLKIVNATQLEKNQVVSAENSEGLTRTLVGCGQSLPDQKILIVNPETFQVCSETEVGEIWVTGPSIAKGYWNKPQETQETFNATLATGEGPFLRTGDLGFLDEGELFITGRIKDVIIINGRNHYPQDIEWTVEQSHALIRPNCTAGFPIEVDGEERLVIVAEVQRQYWQQLRTFNQDNGSAQKKHPKQELTQAIRRAISLNHELQVYQTVLLKPGTIPKTSSGKIQRHACRASFLAGTLAIVDE